MKFKVAAALATAALCAAAVVSCSSGPAGTARYLSEFSPSGRLLFNAKLPDGVGTYRAYRLPWNPGG